jgi:hypothetical protein
VAEARRLTEGKVLPTGLYDAACIFALASAAAGKDAKLSTAEHQKLAEQYAVQSLARLAAARVAGFFQDARQVAHLEKDPDLDILRARADFKKLLAELKDAGNAKSRAK